MDSTSKLQSAQFNMLKPLCLITNTQPDAFYTLIDQERQDSWEKRLEILPQQNGTKKV